MTALTLLAFVGILALASMSEARLCRSQLPRRGQNSSGPKHCYTWTTPQRIQEQVYNDMRRNYTVWSEISDETKKKKMVEELRRMLRQIPKTEFEPIYHLHMTNIAIKSLEVPERLFKVHEINFVRGPFEEILGLSIFVPNIHVTLSSSACREHDEPASPCRVLYNFENTHIHMITKWPNSENTRMSHLEIMECIPENIKARLYIGRETAKQRRAGWQSAEFQLIREMAKSHVPDRNSNFQQLVKTFVRAVLS